MAAQAANAGGSMSEEAIVYPTITNGDRTGSPIGSLRSPDGRTIELWSYRALDVEAFALDWAGEEPAEPNWVTGGTSSVTVGTTTTLKESTGNTSATETTSGDAQNQLLLSAWQQKWTQYLARFTFAVNLANQLLQHANPGAPPLQLTAPEMPSVKTRS
jgi:hypothetical protein